VVVLGNCFFALHEGFLHKWYPRPHVSGIGVVTPSCIAKSGIDYFHLVREDLVYVYTNSRVLNQNVPFTDEAATE
jgi:hypothetical protein